VKKCPFDAIMIINLPKNMAKHTTHRYGPNSFKLHRLSSPAHNGCVWERERAGPLDCRCC
jgi:translation initiation factor RLI1